MLMTSYLPITEFFSGGQRTPLAHAQLPDWADPTDREENIHHALRHLFESSDWDDLIVHGPEANIGSAKVDIVLDISSTIDHPSYQEIEVEIDECIGIEVKSFAEAFERSSDNLKQVAEQSRLDSLSRVYVCTPESDHETRLDIDPHNSELINWKEFSESSIAFRGVTGTIQLPDGREISKSAYYKRLLNQDKDKLIEELKKEGDLKQVRKNLEETDAASTAEQTKYSDRGGEWLDPILKEVGILRFDLDTGEVRVQRNAERLEYIGRRSAVTGESISESDVVHAVWRHYRDQPNARISVEVELPSLERINKPDRIEQFLGEKTTRRAPRIDAVVQKNGVMTGVEVKGPEPDWDRLMNGQLPVYERAAKLDKLDVAVPETVVRDVKERLQDSSEDVGILSCEVASGSYTVERVM